MSIKSQYNGFKRTNWEYTTNTKKKLIKQFEQLGMKVPKYISESNNITPKKLGQALNRIEKAYQKSINKIPGSFSGKQTTNVINSYNQTVEKALTSVENSSTLTSMEKQYLQGQVLALPGIRQRTFSKSADTLNKIANITFKNDKARQRFTQQLVKRNRQISKMIDTGNFNQLFNQGASTRQFNRLINDPKMLQEFSDRDLKYLEENFKLLTPFEREVFIRNRLTELRDRYLLLADGDNESGLDFTRLYNGLLYGMQNIAQENRGVSLIDILYENRRK